MGRSVMTAAGAQRTVFFDVLDIEDAADWECFQDNITADLMGAFPSLAKPRRERWNNRECLVILENELGEFTLSEYCGVAALCFVPSDNDENRGLAQRWGERINLDHALRHNGGMLRRVGFFSNGEAVYQRVAA